MSDYLHDLCVDLLDTAKSALGADCPKVTYVSHGPPAWDCDQLVVWLGPVTHRQNTTKGQTVPMSLAVGAFHIDLARSCAPAIGSNARPPTADRITAHARQMNRDASALLTYVRPRLRDVFSTCSRYEVGSLEVVGTEGAFAGWRWDLLATLNDPG